MLLSKTRISGRAVFLLAIIGIALIAPPQFTAEKGGIDSRADDGCYCHTASDATSVTIIGLPDSFNASTEYNLTISVVNDEIIGDANQGGFRLTVNQGTIVYDDAKIQTLDGGLTHTAEGNDQRSWDMVWTSPADDTKVVEFKVWGNAVNGDVSPQGDAFAGTSYDVAGVNAGPIQEVVESKRAMVVLLSVVLLVISLMTLAALYVFYLRNPDGFSMANFGQWLKGWMTTTDHKGVGLLYLNFGLLFFLVGGVLALLFRIQLAIPMNDFLTEQEYNSFFTLHGTTMVFLAAMPMIAGFANYIVPLQIGAQDLAFPRVNALGFWLLPPAAFMLFAGIFSGQAADITWVMYPPYSTSTGGADMSANAGTTLFVGGMILLGASSTLSGVNFITTFFTMRGHGVSWMKMPLFSWSILISMFMLFMSLPALIIGVLMMFLDRTIGSVFFATNVGDPILFQHLFWFFGHPEVYVVVIPAFGVVSEVLATSARRSIFGYKSMVYAMAGIGVVGFIVWGHHMLTSGMDPKLRFLMMAATMLVALPTGVKVFNWLATLWGGSLVMKTHTLWALGFLLTFTLGGISGMFFPVAGLDMHFHDTYFVVAHFHYVFVGGVVFGLFSAIYYWYPKWTGRLLNEKLGLLHFLTAFISYNAAFWPMHRLGIMGMPRRTHSYAVDSGYGDLNMTITIWAIIFGLSNLIMVVNMIYSQKRGQEAGPDPWGGWSLEWSTTSPPPTPSFAEIPIQKDANTEHHPDGFVTKLAKRFWAIGEKKGVKK